MHENILKKCEKLPVSDLRSLLCFFCLSTHIQTFEFRSFDSRTTDYEGEHEDFGDEEYGLVTESENILNAIATKHNGDVITRIGFANEVKSQDEARKITEENVHAAPVDQLYILDSGASHHFIQDANCFESFEKKYYNVTTASGKERCRAGALKANSLNLRWAICLPTMQHRGLISMSQLQSQGCEARFMKGGRNLLSLGDRTIPLWRHEVAKLYILSV